jgi:cytochrome c2
VDNSVKLPVAALSVAVLTIGSLIVRTSSGGGSDPAAQGAVLFTQLGCQGCHSVTGADGVGPALNNAYNRPVTLDNGETVTADDTYMRAAILQPDSQIVKGYTAGVMSAGITSVLPKLNSGSTTDDLLAYLKSISTGGAAGGASPSAGGGTTTAGSGTPRPAASPTR